MKNRDHGEDQNGHDRLSRQHKEDEYWQKRREKRDRYASRGVREAWGRSPSHTDLQRIYEEHDEAATRVKEEAKEGEKVDNARLKKAKKEQERAEAGSPSSSDRHKKKEHKKEKKSKKSKKDKSERSEKKHKKRRKLSDSEVSIIELPANIKKEYETDDWVELTKKVREKEDRRNEKSPIRRPQIPKNLMTSSKAESPSDYPGSGERLNFLDRTSFRRKEEETMAAYAVEGKRIPRRGEIGLDEEKISKYEQAGYVMSGLRHETMEAVRQKKEKQIMNAEEKRLLSGFTREQRQQKEEATMKQFQTLLASKRGL